MGKQENGIWVFSRDVFSRDVFLSSSGEQLPCDLNEMVWIGHIHSGPGVANEVQECCISLPLSTDPLCLMLHPVRDYFAHNFFPAVLTISSTLIALEEV